MLERLNSLWVGDELGYIERLSIVSAMASGHPYTIYSYAPEKLRGVPNGAEVRNAREVMSDETLLRFFNPHWAALGTDFFRYALLAKGLGYWVDLDMYFLRPFDFDQEYVFGWEHESSINGAVLRIPPQSNMLRDLLELPKTNWRPPFFGPRRTLLYYWARLSKGDVHPEDHPWGTFGPAMITYLAKRHGVAKQAQQRTVFYPVRYQDAGMFSGPPKAVEKILSPQTRAVHLWHSKFDEAAKLFPPSGSYLEEACRKYGIQVKRTS
jgi:hypothetical protein